jgi:hypothetical protein
MQRSTIGGDPVNEIPPIVGNVLGSSGRPLDGPTRAALEPRFGYDFSHVRIHDDARASTSAQAVGARAYTVGSDVVFGGGQYEPGTDAGRGLIAHELAHVVQQAGMSAGLASAPLSIEPPHGRLEREAQAIERSARDPVAPLIVREVGHTPGFHRAIDFSVPISGSLEEIANNLLAQADAATRAVVERFDQARRELSGVASLSLLPDELKELAEIRERLLGMGPRWLRTTAALATALPLPIELMPITVSPWVLVALLLLVIILIILQFAGAGAEGDRLIEKGKQGRRTQTAPSPTEEPQPQPSTQPPPSTQPRPQPSTQPRPQSAPTTETQPSPEGGPQAGPGTGPIPVPPLGSEPRPRPGRCPFPTGLTPADPIPMKWFKPRTDDVYPRSLTVQGITYDRDDPDNPRSLPHGEPIGVPEHYWPFRGKVVSLLPEERGKRADDFRSVLKNYGLDLGTGLDVDHVQDIDWDGPDSFENLWPIDSSANRSAGTRQNRTQRVSFCETPRGPARQDVTIAQIKAEGRHFGRYFIISDIGI